ncbi:MAG: hypothetical protein HKP58_17255 [Desulfatitalea sp.]|nr:hypothetical protein [Desulfatitalea sp.]NNK02162.1 hypothetical protein [Desulfatitalea sp.]
MAKVLNLTPPPTGHELLLKAFEESDGKMVEFTDEQEVVGLTPEMFQWWMVNIPTYYRLWYPKMHFVEERWQTSEGEMRGIIKEMIWPYYCELNIGVGPGGLHLLTPDGEIMGKVGGGLRPTSDGIIMEAVHTLPAKTPESFCDAIRAHFKEEVQDLPRFLPQLYKHPERYEQPPTGHELLLKAFEESGDKTVDVVVDQQIAGITPEMFQWWMVNSIPYYRLWCPEMHFVSEVVLPPGATESRIIIKEMIWPYYCEFRVGLQAGGGGSLLTPDDKKMGQLIHTFTASSQGINLHSIFTFPETTPQPFLDAMREHCIKEFQDLPRFVPELYKQKTGK